MRRFRKAAALGLAALMAVGSVNFAGVTTGAAGLPTTDGHDKYVNKNVFDVISSDTFGTKELESPLFDKTKVLVILQIYRYQHLHMTSQVLVLYGRSRRNMIM